MRFQQLRFTAHALQRWRLRIGEPVPSPVELGEMVLAGKHVGPLVAHNGARPFLVRNPAMYFVQLDDVIFALRPTNRQRTKFMLVTVFVQTGEGEPESTCQSARSWLG